MRREVPLSTAQGRAPCGAVLHVPDDPNAGEDTANALIAFRRRPRSSHSLTASAVGHVLRCAGAVPALPVSCTLLLRAPIRTRPSGVPLCRPFRPHWRALVSPRTYAATGRRPAGA